MTKAQHELLSKILMYVLTSEEKHFEESGEPDDHIYNLARSAWVEFEMDMAPKN